jgi:hypothetical protein
MKELDDIAKPPPPLDDNTNAADDAGRKEDESELWPALLDVISALIIAISKTTQEDVIPLILGHETCPSAAKELLHRMYHHHRHLP